MKVRVMFKERKPYISREERNRRYHVLRGLAGHIRDRHGRPPPLLTWPQVDARDRLAELIKQKEQGDHKPKGEADGNDGDLGLPDGGDDPGST